MSEAIKQNVKRLLSLTNSTHAQLAEIAGVTRSTVSHWVKGTSEPRMGAVRGIADHFGIRESSVLEENGMKFVCMGRDGRLYEDSNAKAAALNMDIMNLLASMSEQGPQGLSPLDGDELDLVRMFRSMNDEGRNLASATVAAFAKSGDYSE